MNGNEDSNAGPFSAPACPGHHGHFGGGKHPHIWCTRRNMLVPWRASNGRHLATTYCVRGAERKRRRLSEEESREISEMAF